MVSQVQSVHWAARGPQVLSQASVAMSSVGRGARAQEHGHSEILQPHENSGGGRRERGRGRRGEVRREGGRWGSGEGGREGGREGWVGGGS